MTASSGRQYAPRLGLRKAIGRRFVRNPAQPKPSAAREHHRRSFHSGRFITRAIPSCLFIGGSGTVHRNAHRQLSRRYAVNHARARSEKKFSAGPSTPLRRATTNDVPGPTYPVDVLRRSTSLRLVRNPVAGVRSSVASVLSTFLRRRPTSYGRHPIERPGHVAVAMATPSGGAVPAAR